MRQRPVAHVGDCASGLSGDFNVVEGEVLEWSFTRSAYVEGTFCSDGAKVPDMHIAKMRQALRGKYGRSQNLVIRGNISEARGNSRVAVAGVPVHRDVDGDGDVVECQVMDADVARPSAAGVRGLEEHSRGHVVERVDV